ncbi:hypothetical protein KI387_018034, partial [Taxus chinensis]
MVHLVLATLAHSFDWALPDGFPSEKLDMSDELGSALKKAQELTTIPTQCLPHHLYLLWRSRSLKKPLLECVKCR